jgi:L-threonylcarbamoyladenylate synthase
MDFADDLKKSIDTLRSGGVLLYPTDTIWGLGCDASDESAIDKIYILKQRPLIKTMIVLVDSPAMLERYTDDPPPMAFDLIEVSDGPLTLVLPARKGVLAPSLISADGYIAVRVCHDEFCSTLISRFRKPVVSTSANITGEPSPAIFSEISQAIKNGVDYIVGYRQNDSGRAKPSPIIKVCHDGTIEILRK